MNSQQWFCKSISNATLESSISVDHFGTFWKILALRNNCRQVGPVVLREKSFPNFKPSVEYEKLINSNLIAVYSRKFHRNLSKKRAQIYQHFNWFRFIFRWEHQSLLANAILFNWITLLKSESGYIGKNINNVA